MAILASSPADPRSVGNASILSGRITDFFSPTGNSYAIAYGLKGVSSIELKKRNNVSGFVCRPGNISITPGWASSEFRSPGNLETLNLSISPAQLQSIVEREFDRSSQSFELVEVYNKPHAELSNLGQAFASLLRSPRQGVGLYTESLWSQIALQLIWNFSSLNRIRSPKYENLSDNRVLRVIDYLQSSYSEEVSLGDLARLADLTPNYFLNAFKKATGKTPHHFLRDIRMEKARELLANPQLSILSIALSVGYTSQSHFTTVFSKETGMTPARFRAETLGLNEQTP